MDFRQILPKSLTYKYAAYAYATVVECVYVDMIKSV
jgi:hypothetical protein